MGRFNLPGGQSKANAHPVYLLFTSVQTPPSARARAERAAHGHLIYSTKGKPGGGGGIVLAEWLDPPLHILKTNQRKKKPGTVYYAYRQDNIRERI